MRYLISSSLLFLFFLTGCTSLTYQEQQDLTSLKYQGITVDRVPGGWEPPASPLTAGLLNLLPGGGNFYLASGNAADSSHWVYGFLNLLTWPISILWGVPEAAIDAGNINKREMLNYYKYSKHQPRLRVLNTNQNNQQQNRSPVYRQQYNNQQYYRQQRYY